MKYQPLDASDAFGRGVALLGELDDDPDTVEVAVGVSACDAASVYIQICSRKGYRYIYIYN